MTLLDRIQSLNCKVVVICPDNSPKYSARKATMSWMLEAIGFPPENIEHFKSEAIRYPQCLVKANIDILLKYIDTPVLILEDDLAYTEHGMVEIPDDADAVYLGLSELAGHPTMETYDGVSRFEHVEGLSHTVRVLNMLATHAIFYKTRRYKEAVIHALEAAQMRNGTNDLAIARLQPLFRVYASRIPVFYQSRVFNPTPPGWECNVEDQTNIGIYVTDKKECVPFRRYGGKTMCTKYPHTWIGDRPPIA
jgi:hypothetical protein